MNKQQAFDTQLLYFSRPGAELAKQEGLTDGQEICVYRSRDKTKRCAVGCCIPDELYDKPYTPGLEDSDYEGATTVGQIIERSVFTAILGVDEELDALLGDEDTHNWFDLTQPVHDSESEDAEDFVTKLWWMGVGAGLTNGEFNCIAYVRRLQNG